MSHNCMALHDQGSWGRLAGVPTRQKERSTVTVQSACAPLSWHATKPHNLRNLLIEMHVFVLHGTRMGWHALVSDHDTISPAPHPRKCTKGGARKTKKHRPSVLQVQVGQGNGFKLPPGAVQARA